MAQDDEPQGGVVKFTGTGYEPQGGVAKFTPVRLERQRPMFQHLIGARNMRHQGALRSLLQRICIDGHRGFST